MVTQKLKNEIIRVDLISKAFRLVEDLYLKSQYDEAYNNNESLNEFYSLEDNCQVGVQLTAQISHCFYKFFKYKANDILIECNSFMRVIVDRQKKEKSYDLTIEDIRDGSLHYIEIKLSQNKNSWQGSTSTTNKVNLFLLINFNIDRDVKLGLNNSSLFKGIFCSLVDLGGYKWNGKQKSNNHRTKFEFRVDEWDIFKLRSCIIKGDVIEKKKLYHLSLVDGDVKMVA
tara:strand:- start:313 stop:996 length:684 start_codon:yes stop_codon:yes gene_type:complete